LGVVAKAIYLQIFSVDRLQCGLFSQDFWM